MKKLSIIGLAVAGVLLITGSVSATVTVDDLQPAENNNVASIRVGTAEEGGTAFLNGSIVNEATAVTIADDLRVDGYIFRREVGGSHPIRVADSIFPSKDNVYDLGSSGKTWGSIFTNKIIGKNLTLDFQNATIIPTASSTGVGSIGGPGGHFFEITTYDLNVKHSLTVLGAASVGAGLIMGPGSDIDVSGSIKNTVGDVVTFDDTIKIKTALSAPVTCNSTNKGVIYFDEMEGVFQGCTGSSWVAF